MLVRAATKVVVGRNAVQTVYWRSVKSADGTGTERFVKYNRTCSFGDPKMKSDKMPDLVAERYVHDVTF